MFLDGAKKGTTEPRRCLGFGNLSKITDLSRYAVMPGSQPTWKQTTCLINAVGSNGRCNTIWYKAVFKGGVYETRETVWAFSGAEERRVASLEVGADVA